MPDPTRTYWPIDLLPPDERTPLHEAMIRFFVETYNAGQRPFGTNHFSEIGFDVNHKHDVRFVLRGGHGRHWEPWLADNGRAVRLGPLWDMSESACMVFDGFDAMTQFTLRWLAGESLQVSLEGVPVYNKHRADVPLYLPKLSHTSVG